MRLLLPIILFSVGCAHSSRFHAEFKDAAPLLEQLVAEKARQAVNHFFISPVKLAGTRDEFVWVYWKEERSLIKWEPFFRDEWRLSLCRTWDLSTDVVPTEEEVAGSSYLLTEEWARSIVRDCESGYAHVIAKKPNKAPEPTSGTVTPRAEPRVAPVPPVAHL